MAVSTMHISTMQISWTTTLEVNQLSISLHFGKSTGQYSASTNKNTLTIKVILYMFHHAEITINFGFINK